VDAGRARQGTDTVGGSPPILCGMYYNMGGSGGNIILRISVGEEGGECLNKWGVQRI